MMTNYFSTQREKYDKNGIGVYRNTETIGGAEDNEVFLITHSPIGFTISRTTAREIADALYAVADEWDEADRRYAEDHKPNAEKIIRAYPIGTQFRLAWMASGAYFIKLSDDHMIYFSSLYNQPDQPRTIDEFLASYGNDIPEMV